MKKSLLTVIICLFSLFSFALAADRYPLATEIQKKQFLQLTQQLRCLVCQNESLDASNAPLANDLKRDVYEMVRQGKTSVAIKQYMVGRYGDFVLFKPKMSGNTLIIWLIPMILLVFGLVSVVVYVKQRGK
ncbi:MAG: cytochrome c-type biogenesis protein CcmH [Coxiellaceae bacterium]|nr:cytochrome c-type biogenesis protein CcmH [Coxiellaceae bacterium]